MELTIFKLTNWQLYIFGLTWDWQNIASLSSFRKRSRRDSGTRSNRLLLDGSASDLRLGGPRKRIQANHHWCRRSATRPRCCFLFLWAFSSWPFLALKTRSHIRGFLFFFVCLFVYRNWNNTWQTRKDHVLALQKFPSDGHDKFSLEKQLSSFESNKQLSRDRKKRDKDKRDTRCIACL